jgi:peroxin-19
LASITQLGLGEGGGPEEESELNGLLHGMMSQLMTKDVLYEPLKELDEAVSA